MNNLEGNTYPKKEWRQKKKKKKKKGPGVGEGRWCKSAKRNEI